MKWFLINTHVFRGELDEFTGFENVFRDIYRLACRRGDGVGWGEVKFLNYHEFFHCRFRLFTQGLKMLYTFRLNLSTSKNNILFI